MDGEISGIIVMTFDEAAQLAYFGAQVLILLQVVVLISFSLGKAEETSGKSSILWWL